MPWIRGFEGSQPYSQGEFQETLWERFRGLSGVCPEFLPESASRTGGMSSPKKAHKHKEMGPQNWTLDPTPKTPLDPPPQNSLGAWAPSLTPRPGSLRNSLCRFSLGVFSVRDSQIKITLWASLWWPRVWIRHEQGTQTQTLGSGFPGGGGVFHVKGWGPKVRYVPQNQGDQLFWRDIPGFCWDIQESARKVREKKVYVQLAPLLELAKEGLVNWHFPWGYGIWIWPRTDSQGLSQKPLCRSQWPRYCALPRD